jgi:hypothetical protein|tara:strand:+ start:656 stop:880 length:225 start_codon:yes stop_codon:yes gene_type:complete
LTVIEWSFIQLLTVSIDYSLFYQSWVLQEAIIVLKSSMSYGSTGFETDGCLFLKAVLDEPVMPNPLAVPLEIFC